jgi:spermidine synthase
MSGVANLFTLEFFQAAKKRLTPDGVLCQWIHLYQISPQDILIFLKTFHKVFPHMSVWIDDTDMLIVGSTQAIRIDPALLAKRMSEPEVEQSLIRSDLTPQNLLKKYVGDERMVKLLRSTLPVNTDDHPILEFSAPQSLFWNRSAEIRAAMAELKRIADQTDFDNH